ncbi:MAG: hypothetical protein QM820_05430 [Minicystis sp.]
MEQVQTFNGKTASGQARYTLDSLAELDVDALGPVYAAGTVPGSLAVLDGHPRGRMLAVKTLDHGTIAGALRSFSGASTFPWGGKSFAAEGATSGTGINRVHLFGRHQLFPFETRFAPSVIDGRETIVLDYDLPDNPYLIRKIHDEIREVSPGLFLGPAMWKTKDGHAFVLWFALDTSTQAKPIGSR